MTKEERFKIFLETVAITNQKFYFTQKNRISMLPSVENESVFYDQPFTPNTAIKRNETKIVVENKDSLIMAKNLIDEGLHPAVLNMANRFMPGGGVLQGSGAQEENIFRRTTLFKSLYKYHKIGANFGVEQERQLYPMDDNYGGIYSKNVVVFRDSEFKRYDVLERPFLIDVVSVAAIPNPQYNDKFELSNEDIKKEKNKIRTILNIALENGNDSIVLGAFGCGAFHTPPKAIVKCFHEVFEEDFYKNKFKTIAFAILDTNSNYEKHNPEGNFKPFKEEFS